MYADGAKRSPLASMPGTRAFGVLRLRAAVDTFVFLLPASMETIDNNKTIVSVPVILCVCAMTFSVLSGYVSMFEKSGPDLPNSDTRDSIRSEIPGLISHWLHEFDRAAALPAGSEYNSMHAFGMGVCVLMHHTDASELTSFDSVRELRDWYNRVCVCDAPWHSLTWRGVHHIVLSIQLEFGNLFRIQDGFMSVLPVDRIIMCLMQRVGCLMCHDYRHDDCEQTQGAHANTQHDMDNVQLLVDVDAQNWRTPRPEAVRQLLLALHTVLGAFCLFMHSEYIPAPDAANPTTVLEDFHRESSMDDFYELAMIATVPLGSIVQYKDKFRHLFHSVSQVVYYHFPAYQRTKQLTIEQLQQEDTAVEHLLPLIQQLHPMVPVLYEHTGAGLREAHERHPFAWVVLGSYVVLVDRQMQSYAAKDLRSLLRLLDDGHV